jgi:hypothetical protein
MTTTGYTPEPPQLPTNYTLEVKLEPPHSDLTMVANKEMESDLPSTDNAVARSSDTA